MNAQRRKLIEELHRRLSFLHIDIEELKDQEQEYYDNMPESLQGSDKGDKAQTAIDALEAAYDNLEECLSSLEEAKEV